MLKASLLIVLVGLIAFAWYNDLLGALTIENVRTYQEQLGWWFPVLFVLAFVIGELLQIPSVLWIFFAGLLWPWWIALPISLVAAVAAATVSLLVARYFVGNRFGDRLPKTVADLDKKLKRRPVIAIIVVRLTTFLHPAMHWVLAVSSVKLPAFLLGTFIGIIPMTLALVLLGEAFMAFWNDYSHYIVGVVLSIVAIYAVWSARRKRL